MFDFCQCGREHVRIKQEPKKKTNPKENRNNEQCSKEPGQLTCCRFWWMMKDEDEKEGIYRLDILTAAQDMVDIMSSSSCHFYRLGTQHD